MSASVCNAQCHDSLRPVTPKLNWTVQVAAILLWVPHCLASLYVAAPVTTASVVCGALLFYAASIALTYYVTVYRRSGDYLLVISWVLGVCSEAGWMLLFPNANDIFEHSRSFPSAAGASASEMNAADQHDNSNSRLLWIVVSMLHGTIGGFLCKWKDMDEGRYYPTHAIGERLYVVMPFCTGQWFCFILRNGWRGIIVENLTILLSLAMVGYSMISYKLLRQHKSLAQGDVIGFVVELLTTSFGVVFTAMVLGNIFVTSLMIPFIKSLFSLNALVSSVGIVMELIVYEVV